MWETYLKTNNLSVWICTMAGNIKRKLNTDILKHEK
jgi:hypothetical protein